MSRPFKRVTEHEVLGGVAAGLAYTLGWPTWVVRLGWFLLALGWGTGVWIYLLLWLFVPAWASTPEDYQKVCTGEDAA